MNTNHTPTPWHVATNAGGPHEQPAFPSIRDSSGLIDGEDIVCMPLGFSDVVKANAAFIVLACNSHKALLDALEEIQWRCDGHEDITERGAPNLAMAVAEIARAAIAKATPENPASHVH